MKIKFYPYDFEYKIRDGKILVYLYSKLENNEKVCVIHEYQPYFYASLQNVDQKEFKKRLETISLGGSEPVKVIKLEESEKELLGKKQTFLKIFVNYPKAVPIISKEIQSWGIECYEKDVLFVHRYLRDNKILPMTLVEADGVYLDDPTFTVPKFFAESVQQVGKETTSWKILALDIETYALKKEIDPKRNPILMVGFYGINEQGQEFTKVITWKKFSTEEKYIEFVDNESELLLRVSEVIKEYLPDIITGYFSDGFDFPYLKARADVHNIPMKMGLDGSELITGTKADFREGDSKIRGILHLDVLKFVKYIFGKNLKTDSYSLDAVASELLGHAKHKVDLDKLAGVWDNNPQELEEFCAYNLQDSKLTYQLCSKLLLDMVEFSKIVGLPTFDVIRMRFSRLVENYIMKRAMEYNVIAPNKPINTEIDQRRDESIQGAFVYEPTPGLYTDLVVFDFRSLYPTIIVSHNIGPEGLCCKCCEKNEHVPERDEYWFCKEKKFLPTVLADLINRRSVVKKQMKEGGDEVMLEARSYALKILANSFYGYLGFFGARWYCLECAASTTAYARYYIKNTIKKAEEKGFQVCYGDTDSCFFQLGEKTIEDAMVFMEEINSDLSGQMELEYEGYFPRGLFVAVKGSNKGAKKKYALLREDGTTKITGFETVRRNWSSLAKEAQEHVLELVLGDKPDEAVEYVKDVIKDLKEGKIPASKLILRTQITRELSKYDSIGPHVLVAMKLAQQGERIVPGTVIEYIIVEGPGIIRERARIPSQVGDGEYDADYYLNHQLMPAVSSIFLVLGYKEDEIFSETKQTGLGSFF